MKGLKNGLILLLALGVIVLGAFLPELVGRMQDAASDGKVEFATISRVKLQVQKGLTMRQKLALLGQRTDVETVSEEEMTRRASELPELTEQLLAPYREAGLFEWELDFSAQLIECRSMRVYLSAGEEYSNLFWHLELLNQADGWYLAMIIDDRTGALCFVNYDSFQPTTDSFQPATSSAVGERERMELFREIYFDGLGEEFSDLTFLQNSAYGRSGDGIQNTTYTWYEEGLGACAIRLETRPDGFSAFLNET